MEKLTSPSGNNQTENLKSHANETVVEIFESAVFNLNHVINTFGSQGDQSKLDYRFVFKDKNGAEIQDLSVECAKGIHPNYRKEKILKTLSETSLKDTPFSISASTTMSEFEPGDAKETRYFEMKLPA